MKRLVMFLLIAGSSAVQAQSLGDPLRPPSAPASSGAETVQEASPNQLQSVLISPSRKLAVINGQTVALGGRIGDATLARVSETGVVLKRGATLETLHLLPGIEKKKAVAAGRPKGEKP